MLNIVPLYKESIDVKSIKSIEIQKKNLKDENRINKEFASSEHNVYYTHICACEKSKSGSYERNHFISILNTKFTSLQNHLNDEPNLLKIRKRFSSKE